MSIFILGNIPELEYVYGECALKENTHSLDTKDDMECYQKCKTTIGCTAFSYEYNKRRYEDCHLYQGGPYDSGNYRANTKCYTMPNGKFFKGILLLRYITIIILNIQILYLVA